jgi:hypothetical protein
LIFVDAGEHLVMAYDAIMPSNLLIAPVEEEELEGTLLDVNVSQKSCDEELFQRVVRTRVNSLNCNSLDATQVKMLRSKFDFDSI